jgi:Protein kinase domain
MTAGLLATDPVTLGPYRLLGRLGGGGMGQVFLGQSPGGRLVAVKVIRPEFAADPEFRVRFAREVANARQVSGMFTALLVDADTEGPVPWLATAYIPGPSLSDAVRQSGPLPLASVMPLASGLAEALAAVHGAGVVHRDLKPSNVLLASDGPRVIDFGISHAAEASTLTQSGAVIGSPGYMSPEQAQGRPVGPESDVFSLGAVLAFAVTGAGPFGSGSVASLVYRVVCEPPDLDRVPPELRPLIERCLAKEPGDRPRVGELLADLGGELISENWLPEAVADTLPRYEPSARIAAVASLRPPLTDAGALKSAQGTPATETLGPETGGRVKQPPATLATELSATGLPAAGVPAPEAQATETRATEARAGAGIALAGQASPLAGGRSLPDRPSLPDRRGLPGRRWLPGGRGQPALPRPPWLRRHGRAITAVVAVAIAAILATWLTLGTDTLGGHTADRTPSLVAAGGSDTPTHASRTSVNTEAPSGHDSPKAWVTPDSPTTATVKTPAPTIQRTRQPAASPATTPPVTSTPLPSPSVYPVQGADQYQYNDPNRIGASLVIVNFYACYAWLDNDGSGNLSGVLDPSYDSCDAEVFWDGGPIVSLAASNAVESTSAISDTGHTMKICVWAQGDQSGEQCSPLFGMNGDVPTQQ